MHCVTEHTHNVHCLENQSPRGWNFWWPFLQFVLCLISFSFFPVFFFLNSRCYFYKKRSRKKWKPCWTVAHSGVLQNDWGDLSPRNSIHTSFLLTISVFALISNPLFSIVKLRKWVCSGVSVQLSLNKKTSLGGTIPAAWSTFCPPHQQGLDSKSTLQKIFCSHLSLLELGHIPLKIVLLELIHLKEKQVPLNSKRLLNIVTNHYREDTSASVPHEQAA